jgi:ElaB/YqjD/DUF883 family membrane-anchored ribosome-binding protein
MRERDLDTMTSRVHDTTRGLTDATRENVARMTEYARLQADRMSERAGDLAEGAGAALDTWTSQTRGYVRAHPLQAMAITVAAGYLLGRIFRRA